MVTIYDIAKTAGVAKSTVANALTGKGKVSEATRQRVLQCASEMAYRPNMLARSLSQHKTLTIALVLPSITNPFYPEIMEAIENIVREYEYQTLFCNTDGDFALAACRRERNRSHASRCASACVVDGTGRSTRKERGHRQNRDREGGPMTWKEARAPALRPG